eukprot:jgi/Galph1/3663/GphlegSOOS_G2323.1
MTRDKKSPSRSVVVTKPSLFWLLSSKFPALVEEALVLAIVLLSIALNGTFFGQPLSFRAIMLALAIGSLYLRPITEAIISCSLSSPVSNNASSSSPLHSPLLRQFADSGLSIGVCLFPLLLVPSRPNDFHIFQVLFLVSVSCGTFVLIGIVAGIFDDPKNLCRVFVFRELTMSFVLTLLGCLILIPSCSPSVGTSVAIVCSLFPVFLRICLYCLQGSFSLAEAIIVSESAVCVLVYCLTLFLQHSKDDSIQVDEIDKCLEILTSSVGMATVVFFFGYSYLTLPQFTTPYSAVMTSSSPLSRKEASCMRKTLYFIMFIAVDSCGCYIWSHHFISEPFRTFLHYQMRWKPTLLLIYWCGLLGLVLVVIPPQRLAVPPIVARKYYHVVLLLILFPVFFIEVAYIRFCSMAALYLLIIIELGRVSGVYGVYWLVNDFMSALVDNRDKGTIYLTHLYLLLGSCFTLWQYPPCSLLGMSGIVTLGIVDSVTACFGTFYGKRKWPGTGKTMEGTFMGMLFGVLSCYILYHNLCYSNQSSQWSSLHLIVILTCSYFLAALLEAFTVQIDNLVVPLYHYVVLRQLTLL